MDIDVLYLSEDKTQTAGFYIYDIEANKIISSFKPIVLLGNSLYLIDIGEEQKEKEHMTFHHSDSRRKRNTGMEI